MLLSTLALHAAAAGLATPRAGARLGAGQRVEVRWEGLPTNVDEMELVVSVNGGRGFARVADLDPATSAYSWRVPSLPTEHAILGIRGRIDGEETLLLVTGPFTIERTEGQELQPLSYHGGELWTDSTGSSTPTTSAELGAPPRASALAPGSVEVEGPSGIDRVDPPAETDELAAVDPSTSPALPNSRSRSPLSFPQRK